MKTVFLIVLSAFYAENGAFLMAFHNFKSISHRFSKQFHMLFYCFAEYSRQGETFSYYGFKAYRRCNHVILKMIGYKRDTSGESNCVCKAAGTDRNLFKEAAML